MAIFRFICWLRGFHISAFSVDAFEKQQIGNLTAREFWGNYSPCLTCGKIAPTGKHENHALITRWMWEA